jgi:hypothetical protein
MTVQTSQSGIFKDTNVQTTSGEEVRLMKLLAHVKPTFLHFQNSHRKGQSCTIAMPIVEENLENLSAVANVIVIVRETPFDEYVDTPSANSYN